MQKEEISQQRQDAENLVASFSGMLPKDSPALKLAQERADREQLTAATKTRR